jgi:hypothetical protein
VINKEIYFNLLYLFLCIKYVLALSKELSSNNQWTRGKLNENPFESIVQNNEISKIHRNEICPNQMEKWKNNEFIFIFF